MGISTSHPDTVDVTIDHAPWSTRDLGTVAGATVIVVALLAGALARSVPAAASLPIVALVPAALVDIRERRLPDVWVACAGAVWLAATWTAWTTERSVDIAGPLLALVVFTGPILALHLISPTAMGFGDVKASAVLAAAVGTVDWRLGLVSLTLAAGTAGAFGVIARRRTLSFGPFLVAGAAVAVLAADMWLGPIADGSARP